MTIRTTIQVLTVAAVHLLAAPAIQAQECRVSQGDVGKPPFLVTVKEQTYVATTREDMTDLASAKARARDLETELAGLKAIVKKQEEESKQAQKVIELKDATIAHLEQQNNGLKSLLQDYKRIVADKSTWMTFDAAVGETGDSDPAAMVGVGIWKVRVWKYIQKGNGGWLAGVSLPLF